MQAKTATNPKPLHFGLIMVIYLCGIFMGAIDTSVVTPARTVIQNGLGVGDQTGIWMITIYTLAYASSIPIMGKLADRLGRKTIYLICIILFGTGSLLAGLSQYIGHFGFFLMARAIQAIGGGGIMPIASAEFGTTFPEDKRGMALGMVGGVYGIATVVGGSLGSAILGAFGLQNWGFIFFINIPISLFIIICGFIFLPNTKIDDVKPIDKWGTLFLVMMILSLLYGLRNIDFFNFVKSFTSTDVYPFLIIFIVLLPFFIFAEKKAADPIMNLDYFREAPIVITLIISFITGVIMMGMVFVPQFAENALRMQQGSGGYFVMVLGIFAGVGAPVSGRLIDRYGPKLIMGAGFLLSIIGSLFLVLITTSYPNLLTVAICLILIGLGMGFTMGTPLNYMMLDNTKKADSNSALATLSLIRSVGTAIAPAVMVGFIAHAGVTAEANITAQLPKELVLPSLPYVTQLDEETTALKDSDFGKTYLSSVQFPDFEAMEKISLDAHGGVSDMKLPANLTKELSDADVTNIDQAVDNMVAYMADTMKPMVIEKAESGVQNGIDGLNRITASPEAPAQVTQGISTMVSQMTELKNALPDAVNQGFQNYLGEVKAMGAQIQNVYQKTMETGFKQVYMTTAIASAFALAVLLFYKDKHERVKKEKKKG
ncbi:MFS transporter [Eubacterium limosum]|uniref:MFS transporter n=1 Tax=Eubacterium limosum TaxID=1736 RepID=A0ABT5UJQ8_EUBLI|nr:MFS transporter [Eubacterium limosum]MCB6569690.1 MFS transporter [Eubacterium limosum]MDE1469138.1 MFS transporter [Eubacterium limosum]